jgi:hypothetical protein
MDLNRKLFVIEDSEFAAGGFGFVIYDKYPGKKRSNGRFFYSESAVSILFIGQFDSEGDGFVIISSVGKHDVGYIKWSDFVSLPLRDRNGNCPHEDV